ncbi:MAG: AMP-binding protein [Proteobacteria bacterium]|nr:AMP-binding protein [Pseudomonadota bacterium]
MLTDSCNTIIDVLQRRAEEHPDRQYIKFLTDGDEKEQNLTYLQLQESVDKIADWFIDQGYEKGDRVIMLLPNGLEFVQMFYGCLRSGLLPVPLSHQMQAYKDTLIPALKIANPRAIISTLQVVDFMTNKLPDDLKECFEDLEIVGVEEIMKSQTTSHSKSTIDSVAPAYLQFSSGSTGTPKGVIVGHGNIMSNMEQSRIFGNWEEGRNTCLWLPLFHDFGLAAGLIGALYNGGTVILLTPMHFVLKPMRWLIAMSKYDCGYSYAPPFAFDMCLRKMNSKETVNLDLSCMETIVIGAEPVHYDATKRFIDKFVCFGLPTDCVKPGFGMAETVIMFSMSKGLKALPVARRLLEEEQKIKIIQNSSENEDRKDLVDLGPQMLEHKIVVTDGDKSPLSDGQVGEIYMSGPSVCLGYYENEAATEETFRNRIKGHDEEFLSTGDLGLVYENSLYFAGRIKDIIIVRGRNYYPQDLEHAMTSVANVEPDSAVAFPVEIGEEGQQLGIAVEIDLKLLIDMERFTNVVLPEIDRNLVKTLSEHFQIAPVERLYLRSGTVKKTSSGKIKHKVNQELFVHDDFKGLVKRIKDESTETDLDNHDVEEIVLSLFWKCMKLEPILDQPLIDYGGDSMTILVFIDELEEKFPFPDMDLLDTIEDETTLSEIVHLIKAHQIKSVVAF